MHKFTKALAAIGLAAVMSQSAIAENLKLGFLVKQPEEPWFQTEWKFADKAGKDLGFEVIKIAVPDGEKTLNAIDSLAASGAKGFVICTPDPKLGSAIAAKARGYDMKVIAVDDQFVNAKGKPMDTVPLVMMAATKIGERQGQELYKEMQKRGWDVKETAVMAITADELDTARRRTTGSMDALKAAGFPEKQIYKDPTKSNDIPGAFDAANSMLVQHPEVKHWLVVGMNDNTVLGGVRATEGQGFKAPDIIGIGINGVESNLGTAIRTGVVLVMAWLIVLVKGKQHTLRSVPQKELVFLILSGLATGGSWLCYYKALQDGLASVVVPIDKLSILVSIGFSALVFKEHLSKKAALGLGLIVAGTLLMLVKLPA